MLIENKEVLLARILSKFKAGMETHQRNRKQKETKKKITKFKRKMKINDTIAGVITGVILFTYWYEVRAQDNFFGKKFETFIDEQRVNGQVVKRQNESTTTNVILRVVMIVLSAINCKKRAKAKASSSRSTTFTSWSSIKCSSSGTRRTRS